MAIVRQRVPFAEEYFDQLVYEPDALGRYRLKPDQKLPHITINSEGYRGESFTGGETLLLLGDSVTFGVGATNDLERFSMYLAQVIHQQVADASVRAYRIYQQYSQLPSLLARLPGITSVVLWGGYADLLYWATSGGSIEGAFSFESKYGIEGQFNRLKRSLGKVLKWGGGEQRGKKRPIQDLVSHMTVYITAIRDLCQTRNIHFYLILQPFLRNKPRDNELKNLVEFYNDKTLEKCGISWYDACNEFHDIAHKTWTAAHLHWIDCQSLLLEDDFLDQVHIRQESFKKLVMEITQSGFLRQAPNRPLKHSFINS